MRSRGPTKNNGAKAGSAVDGDRPRAARRLASSVPRGRASSVAGPARILAASLAVALSPALGALVAQEAREPVDLQAISHLSDEELVAAGFSLDFQTSDVPYAMSVDSLFRWTTVLDEDLESWWRTRGFDPASEPIAELIELAFEVEASFASVPDWRAVDPSFEIDDEARNAWLRDAENRRYRALGSAFGGWLERRRSEGVPPEFLLERLLVDLGPTIASTESMEELEAWMARVEREFDLGLRESMPVLPRQLRIEQREED